MLSLNRTYDPGYPAKNAANMGYCRWTTILNETKRNECKQRVRNPVLPSFWPANVEGSPLVYKTYVFFVNGYIKGRWRRRKSPLNWALSFVCPTPPGNSHRKTRGDLPCKMIVLVIPHWRINCEVVSLTVLKCNILNYSKTAMRKTFVAELS